MSQMLKAQQEHIARLEARDQDREEQMQRFISESSSAKANDQPVATHNMSNTTSASSKGSTSSYVRSIFHDMKKTFSDSTSRRALAQAHLGALKCTSKADHSMQQMRSDRARNYVSPSTLGRF